MMPRTKYLIKKFIWGIYPNKLAKNLDMLGLKNLEAVKSEFLKMFNMN